MKRGALQSRGFAPAVLGSRPPWSEASFRRQTSGVARCVVARIVRTLARRLCARHAKWRGTVPSAAVRGAGEYTPSRNTAYRCGLSLKSDDALYGNHRAALRLLARRRLPQNSIATSGSLLNVRISIDSHIQYSGPPLLADISIQPQLDGLARQFCRQ